MWTYSTCSKAFALTWYRALTWYSSPARPFAAPCRDGRPATRYQAAREPLPRVPTAFQGSNCVLGGLKRGGGTKFKHGTKLGRTLCYESFSRGGGQFLVGSRLESRSAALGGSLGAGTTGSVVVVAPLFALCSCEWFVLLSSCVRV